MGLGLNSSEDPEIHGFKIDTENKRWWNKPRIALMLLWHCPEAIISFLFESSWEGLCDTEREEELREECG